jgi:hypothetical protein
MIRLIAPVRTGKKMPSYKFLEIKVPGSPPLPIGQETKT